MDEQTTPHLQHPGVVRLQSEARSLSRPRISRNSSTNSGPYLPHGPDVLLYPEGAVSEEAVELLHEFVHPHHQRPDGEQTLVGDEEEEGDADSEEAEENAKDEAERMEMANRPWYRRPSPLWILAVMPFTAMAMSACVAPRVEIYTELACRAHKPEYTTGRLIPATFILDTQVANYYSANLDQISPPEFVSGDAGDEGGNPCAKDPEVQAAAAKLIAAMTTVMGVLSCLTTGLWGTLSDRLGRLRVMGISVIGLLVTDFNFIFVYKFSERLPGGYWFLLLGPFVEGLLGGFTAGVAAIHAYLADTTTPLTRTRTFSLSVGLLFIGMAFGPTFGALLIHSTHQVISVFYMATAIHILYTFLVWFVVPESLSPRVMTRNREAHRLEQEEARASAANNNGSRAMALAKKAFYFLTPLTVLGPETVRTPGSTKSRRDWNLTLIAIAFGFSGLVFSSYQYKFQYAAATFGWTSEELGYWLSLVGASRALYLVAILPLIIKLFNRPKPAIQLPSSPSDPLLGSSSPSSSSPERPHPTSSHQTNAHLAPHTPSFDLGLARVSLALEVVCYTVLPFAMHPLTFTGISMLTSLSGGLNPAVQALALELFSRRQRQRVGVGAGAGREEGANGRLFGALSVVQAMCSQIIGPTLFGITYVKTVAIFPKAIFFVSSGCVIVAFTFMSFVRVGKEHLHSQHEQQAYGSTTSSAHAIGRREETLVGVDSDSSALEARDARKKNSGKMNGLVEDV